VAASTTDQAVAHATDVWAREVLPTLEDYIRIPNVSPAYEPGWADLGHMERAVDLIDSWCAARPIPGLTVEVHRLEGRTPVVLVEIPAANGGPAGDTVLLYGHLDKQPEMTGWRAGLGPWEPVVEDGRLFGRGGADDGYSAFAALTAIEAAQAAGHPHARCVVLIEASEESGSCDLPTHLEQLLPRIGTPSLVVCLDSGCLDYERLWMTTSLRGLISGRLEVAIASEGIHSGDASGVVPETFRIARALLDRVDDVATGDVKIREFHVDIPSDRVEQARATAAELAPLSTTFPILPGARPVNDDPVEQILNRSWRPSMAITGAAGLPDVSRAGSVLRPSTSLIVSCRLPPTIDASEAIDLLGRVLTDDPPYGATVTFTPDQHSLGWNAPPFEPWLLASLKVASQATFGAPARAMGEGGSISFMGMLGARFPAAQFVITGVLGPGSNAHGPNEFLDLRTAERLTGALALVLRDHARR
jgi:acetylornithine deacetylase/succinyl-diaminopimelate desuccinylase-like protein